MSPSRKTTGSIALLFVLAVLCPLPAHAQTTGTLSGTVKDSSGGALPGASLLLTNQATGATQTVVAAADGSFSAQLPPGSYSVAASLKGFARKVQKDVKVEAGGTATASLVLEAKREEEITVTAMKREETIHDTPVSVAAPSEADLRSRGVENLEGVAANVGGFTVQDLGPGQSQVAIRGVSAGQIVRDQPGVKEQVGVYLDESVISLSLFTPDLDLFDLNRVEVLRGPQGTLFGSGSLSGTVRYITNPPELGGKAKGFAEFGGRTLDGGSQGGDFKLGFNAPLGDRAAARVVGYYDRLPGFIDDVKPNLTIDKDVNSGNRYGGRAAIRFQPNENFTITPRLVYQKVDMNGWNRVDAYNILANPFTTTRPKVTLGPRQAFSQLKEEYTDKFVLGDVNLNYKFGNVQFTSISSFTYRDLLVTRDTTSLSAYFLAAVFGVGESVYTLDGPLLDATTAKVFTQELRFSSSQGRLQWVLGGFFSHQNREYNQDLFVNGFEDSSGIHGPSRVPKDDLFHSELDYKLNQFAAFGEATLAVNDKLRLTGGLRYYHFSDDKSQVFDGLFGEGSDGKPQSQPGKTDANGVAPRFILSYSVSNTTNLNVQVSKGFRLGGVNDPINVSICSPQDRVTFGGKGVWKDEKAWNYEIGTKSRILGDRGSFNVTAFYMDIRDLQATVTAGTCSSRLIYNVPKARSAGVETELNVAPNRHFDFALSGSFNDSKLKSTVQPTSATGIVEGRRLPTVPKFQLAVAATAHWDWTSGLLGYLTGSFQHVGGGRFTQVADPDLGSLQMVTLIGGPLTQSTLSYNPILPAYDILNARLGILKGKWDVALYVNNLTDENAKLAFDREAGTLARIFYLVNPPRTFGISARLNF